MMADGLIRVLIEVASVKVFSTVCLVSLLAGSPLLAGEWPAWRGPSGTGVVSSDTLPPLNWSADEGVQWKIELPGPGNSSPIVVGDRLFLTQFAPESRERLL